MRPLIVLLLALGIAGCDRANPPAPQPGAEPVDANATQPEAAPAGESTAAIPHGGKVDLSHAGTAMPAMPFTAPDGAPATLTKFRGKPLMVNLWATWCAPCVAEMPTLDTLAAREAGRMKLLVVSQDLAGKRAVDPFFAAKGFKTLEPYLDKQNVLMAALKADTLPVTVFYGADGKERWRVTGAMDWNGAEAKALIDKAVG